MERIIAMNLLTGDSMEFAVRNLNEESVNVIVQSARERGWSSQEYVIIRKSDGWMFSMYSSGFVIYTYPEFLNI